MNLNKNPKFDELKALIEQCDDSAGHHILWVDNLGEVYISLLPEGLTPVGFEESCDEMRMRYETFTMGADYVGPNAAQDVRHVTSLFDMLMKNWPDAKGQSGVHYIDH